jgi:hypothetical protein
MKYAVDTMTTKGLRHLFAIGYVGLNRLKIRMLILIRVDVNANNAIAVFK